MIYKEIHDLNIMELGESGENISFDKLEKVILSKPSNVIYCEKNKKLYGIITMGDIKRASEAGRDFVTVNTRFTSVQDAEYMKARNIFRERGSINALPIINKDGVLTGGWSRWNDLPDIENMFEGGGRTTILSVIAKWHWYCLMAILQISAMRYICMTKSWLNMGLMLRKSAMMRFCNILTG